MPKVSNSQAIHDALVLLEKLRTERPRLLDRIAELEGENQCLRELLWEFGGDDL